MYLPLSYAAFYSLCNIQQLALRIVSHLGLASGPRSLWGVNVELYIIVTSSDARQGKESGDPTVPAIGIATGRPGRPTLVVVRDIPPEPRKSSDSQVARETR